MVCKRYLPALLVFLLAPILSGCFEETPRSLLDDYQSRVANVLEAEVAETETLRFPAFPAKRDRLMITEDIRAGVMDSIELGECDLLSLLVERNSSLGKVMSPSALLSYELRFFQRLHECHRQIESGERSVETKFKDLIQQIYTVKLANLEATVWNGIFASDEIAQQFSQSKDPVPLEGNEGYQASLRALSYLAELSSNVEAFAQHQPAAQLNTPFTLPPALSDQENFFFSLYGSEYGGQLQASLILLTKKLNQTADMINKKLDQRPLCLQQRPTEKAEILQNVFARYYGGKVQPYLSMIHRQGQQWFTIMNSLLQTGGNKRPIAMQQYYQAAYDLRSPTAYWPRYQAAIARHTQAWQRVLSQCGLMPTVKTP